MSVEKVKAFYEQVEADKDLQAQLKNLRDEMEAQRKATVAKLVQIATNAGFQFSPAELAAAQQEAVQELSVEQLKFDSGDFIGVRDPLDCMPGWCWGLE